MTPASLEILPPLMFLIRPKNEIGFVLSLFIKDRSGKIKTYNRMKKRSMDMRSNLNSEK